MENQHGSVNLLLGITYRFEWFVFSGKDDSRAKIEANVIPDNIGFPALVIDNQYANGDQDGNVFLFTLK